MARNEAFVAGDEMVVPVPAGVKSGEPVLIGNLPGVAQTDRDADGNATVWFHRAWHLTVTGAVTQIGSPVYIAADRTLTTTATGNTLFGHAFALKGAAAGRIPVKIAKV